MTKPFDVISTVQRRRRWSTAAKVGILDQAFRPGGSVAATADQHEISRALVYLWRSQARKGEMPGVSVSVNAPANFASVQISPPAEVSRGAPRPPDAPRDRSRPARVEIVLANGRILKVDDCIDMTTLARLVAALDAPPKS
jgi:transposase